jgi:alkylation response protein AidB-like acyl-CoA dehydrogenase
MTDLSTAPAPAAEAEIAALLQQARALGRRFAADAPRLDAEAAAPASQITQLHEAGLLRLTVARRDGGLGATLLQARQVVSAIAQGEPGTALILAMHYSQHASIARNTGDQWPQALARRLALEAASEAALANAAQVEPAMGSPSFGGRPATVARRTAGGWALSGHKLYVTGAPLLRWFKVLAVTDEPAPRIGHFLVQAGAPGLRIVPTWDSLGMRASVSHDVLLADVAVPDADVATLQPAELGLPRDALSAAWYFNLAGSVYDGIARSAQAWLLRFLHQRKPAGLDTPLAGLPTVQHAVGEIALLLASNQWLLDTQARAFDEGTLAADASAAIKHQVFDQAVRAVGLALDLAGNHGLARRNPLERHFRDVQCARIHAPSNPLLQANAGRAALAAVRDDPTLDLNSESFR